MTGSLFRDIEHGTWNGYKAHLKRKQVPCGRCADAAYWYQKMAKQRGHCAPGLGWPLGPGDGFPSKKTPQRKA